MRNWRTYVVAGVTLAILALAGWLALPHLPPAVRVWEGSGLAADSPSTAQSVVLDSAGGVTMGGGPSVRGAIAPKGGAEVGAKAGSRERALHVVAVIGPMLRVPTIAVAPEPVPPPDPFAVTVAREQLSQPPRTAFGTPSVALPELANRAEVTRALRRMYPPELRRASAAGTSVMRLRIDEDGRVIRRYVVATSGNMLLDRVALSSASLMRFLPARFEGRSVRSEVDVPVTFAVVTPADTATRTRAADTAARARAPRTPARPTGTATPGR